MMYEGFSANLSFTGLIGKFVQKKKTRAETSWPDRGKRLGLLTLGLGEARWPRRAQEARRASCCSFLKNKGSSRGSRRGRRRQRRDACAGDQRARRIRVVRGSRRQFPATRNSGGSTFLEGGHGRSRRRLFLQRTPMAVRTVKRKRKKEAGEKREEGAGRRRRLMFTENQRERSGVSRGRRKKQKGEGRSRGTTAWTLGRRGRPARSGKGWSISGGGASSGAEARSG